MADSLRAVYAPVSRLGSMRVSHRLTLPPFQPQARPPKPANPQRPVDQVSPGQGLPPAPRPPREWMKVAARSLGYVATTAGFVAAGVAFPGAAMVAGLVAGGKYLLCSPDKAGDSVPRRAAALVPAWAGMTAAILTPDLGVTGGALLGGALSCALPLAIAAARVQVVTVKIALGMPHRS